ncbi:sigma-70 family RNA polymerase sigma factor [Actinoallomurus purpureus]|uniref:sigma-70 family RNA polymerase sigma factor n=1 Tax=Actinoallomurus purpureus TaxID=478114 RepID=UPI00209269C8|nr:sigma-70 family RNA polymerase sigma factor [Actinoallomurus purpureus]MCO6009170.1 sigma-70 family RNA polymerase sigma factor [Actinoallomurus purpureus]
MDIVQPAGGEPRVNGDYRVRNNELFARRIRLQELLADLRAKADAGEIDSLSEAALRRTERELEEVTLEITVANYGLVRRYVAMFTSKCNEHSEDFESAGKVGLLWAISSYDPSRGPFSSWAFKPIQREVLRAVRDADHPNLNPGDFEKRPAILAAAQAFSADFGVDAPYDYPDIARRAGTTEAQVRRVLDAPRLDSLQASSGAGEEETLWEDRLADPSPSVEDEVLLRFDLRTVSDHGLPSLDARERYVLTRRFGLDGEPEESLHLIGDRLGLSREGVRQIQQKALAKLHVPIAEAACSS